MTTWRIRDFHSSDLDGILHLWETLKATEVEPVSRRRTTSTPSRIPG
jgi:hypothetical protein